MTVYQQRLLGNQLKFNQQFRSHVKFSKQEPLLENIQQLRRKTNFPWQIASLHHKKSEQTSIITQFKQLFGF